MNKIMLPCLKLAMARQDETICDVDEAKTILGWFSICGRHTGTKT